MRGGAREGGCELWKRWNCVTGDACSKNVERWTGAMLTAVLSMASAAMQSHEQSAVA
jgi:hypothetical protein